MAHAGQGARSSGPPQHISLVAKPGLGDQFCVLKPLADQAARDALHLVDRVQRALVMAV